MEFAIQMQMQMISTAIAVISLFIVLVSIGVGAVVFVYIKRMEKGLEELKSDNADLWDVVLELRSDTGQQPTPNSAANSAIPK